MRQILRFFCPKSAQSKSNCDICPILLESTQNWIRANAAFCHPRVRTHNQNMTVAARAIADKKTFGQRS